MSQAILKLPYPSRVSRIICKSSGTSLLIKETHALSLPFWAWSVAVEVSLVHLLPGARAVSTVAGNKKQFSVSTSLASRTSVSEFGSLTVHKPKDSVSRQNNTNRKVESKPCVDTKLLFIPWQLLWTNQWCGQSFRRDYCTPVFQSIQRPQTWTLPSLQWRLCRRYFFYQRGISGYQSFHQRQLFMQQCALQTDRFA